MRIEKVYVANLNTLSYYFKDAHAEIIHHPVEPAVSGTRSEFKRWHTDGLRHRVQASGYSTFGVQTWSLQNVDLVRIPGYED